MGNEALSQSAVMPNSKRTLKPTTISASLHKLTFGFVGLLLLGITLAAYWPVLGNRFVDFDDPIYITENAVLQQGLSFKSAGWAFIGKYAYNWHPLTWISLMTDFELYRLKPMGYHLTNLILHLANTLLLFGVMFRMTRQMWPCALVAALFAVHPLHVESVAWVSERKDVLSAFYFMLSLWAYARYADSPRVGRYLLVLAFYIAGLMAKPMLVSLPFVLIILDYWPLQRLLPPSNLAATGPRPSWRLLIIEKIPFATLAAISCAITFIVQQTTGAVGSFTQYPLGIRIANALLAYQNYLVNMMWPCHLACLYPYKLNLLFWKVVLAGVILLSISALTIRLWRQRRYLIAGWLWYLVTLVPVIGLVQVGNQAMADRYSYIPLIGIFYIIAWGVPDLVIFIFPEPRRRQIVLAAFSCLACVVITLLAIGTRFQVRTWTDTIAVFDHAIAVTKDNFLAHNNLANSLSERGRMDEAVYHYAEALRIKPDYAEAHNNIGVTLAHQGKTDEAIAHYREALRLRPNCAETYVNLGTILYVRRNLDEAAGLFSQAIRINPFLANAHYNLGIILAQKGLLAEAVQQYVAALGIRPDMMNAYNNLIMALVTCREYGKAMIAFRAALRLYREWSPDLTVNLWLLATCQGLSATDRADLIQLAEQFGRPERNQDPAFLDSLGVAYAGADRFPEAIIVTRQALALMNAESRADTNNPVGLRLKRYEHQAPYFEDAVSIISDNQTLH